MTSITCKEPKISKRKVIARRQFLRFLAGSPLLTAASAGTIASLLAARSHEAFAQSYDALRGAEVAVGGDGIITAPSQALDVFEFAPAARKVLFDAERGCCISRRRCGWHHVSRTHVCLWH